MMIQRPTIYRAAVFALSASLMLSGCGHASAEKLAEVSDLFEELQETRVKIEEDYDALYDDALFSRVTDAGQRLDALRDTDLSNATDETLELDILPALTELKESYANIRDLIDQTSEMEQAEIRATEYKRALDFHIVNQSGVDFTSFIWTLREETEDAAAAEDADAAEGSSSDTATGSSEKSEDSSDSSQASSGNSGKSNDASVGSPKAATGSSDASTGATKEDAESDENASKGTSMRNAASQAKAKAEDAAAASSTASTEEADQEEDVLANATILLSLPGSIPEGATLAGVSVPLELTDAVDHRLVLVGTTSTEERISYDLGRADKLNDAVVFSLTLLPEATFEITSSMMN